ncbi:hypothetical protein HNR44_001400 [Geomicrobium halophilum]|uniref:Uncharacterized protein n=1 Tax=Geomicrobium halophilum TaxID=549000 RepID=A0A841PT20_9BACL|nr:hypothetical protein [Geomicrobium halophilum]
MEETIASTLSLFIAKTTIHSHVEDNTEIPNNRLLILKE